MDTHPAAGPVLGPKDKELDQTQSLPWSGGITLTDTALGGGRCSQIGGTQTEEAVGTGLSAGSGGQWAT